mgnify:FL=1
MCSPEVHELFGKCSPVGVAFFSYCSQSLETRQLRFDKGATHFTDDEKRDITQTEDIYALGILIMEVLVGPNTVSCYVNSLNRYTNDSYLFTVKLPTRPEKDFEYSLYNLRKDPCFFQEGIL